MPAEQRAPTEQRAPAEQNGAAHRNGPPQNIAVAIAEVSERATTLVHEEIELAKAEVAEKVATLARGAAVGAVAGVFIITALLFVLVGCAWLLYYGLKIGSPFAYFWGFFIMAAILVVLGAIAGYGAARALRSGTPPVPEMAIEEARRIRSTVAAGDPGGPGSPAGPAGPNEEGRS